MALRIRVGDSFIKQEMARTGAVFGGKRSAYYYFRDSDPAGVTSAVRAAFAARTANIDELDRLTVELLDGSWLNVRASTPSRRCG